jgi:cytochrome P450
MDGIDLTDLDNFAAGFPHHLFEIHRRQAPVWWHAATAHTPDAEGFWSVATYRETLAVQNDPETYSSERGGDRPYGGTLLQDLPTAGVVLNMMDDPRHARIRRLVSGGLTPRMVRRLEDELRRRTGALLDAFCAGQEIDFLTEVAAEPPMQMICILLGVPEEDRHALARVVEPLFDLTGSDADTESGRAWMFEYGTELIAGKRREPSEDMLSVAVQATLADADPPRLSDLELYSFFSLLFAAGAETTRNAMAGGVLALMSHPDQMDRLRDQPGLLPLAVEEMLRWTTPAPSKRRTATRDAELAGHRVRAGEKVLFWEGSANRDDAIFERPMEFDIGRRPNPHLSFGHGIHFCLGASLARLEMRVLFEELMSRFGGFEPAGPVEWTRSNRHTGIRHLPVRFLSL